jgi:two-component system cell cycle response regulator
MALITSIGVAASVIAFIVGALWEQRRALMEQAMTDPLTGAFNRRYMDACLATAIERRRRTGEPASLLMIDVDHFKRINDRHGHLAGDEVLRLVARRIGGAVRGSDVAARYGGEEFVILLPATGREAGGLLAERIRRAVADEPFEITGSALPLPVTVSIGVAEHHDVAGTDDLDVAAEQLLARADTALYEAKAAGRNNVAHAARA